MGTTFTVCLPLPVGQARPAVANVSQALQLPQMRMLVVDDVPANIELLQIHLDRGATRSPLHATGKRLSPPARPV